MKCSDIPDDRFLAAVTAASTSWGSTMLRSLEAELPDVPRKVVLAKARKLIRRGLLGGCGCGCRGDFRVIPPVTEAAVSP